MSDSKEVRGEATPRGGKRRGRLRRVLRVLAVLLVLIVLAVAMLLCNPVRTLATLEKVDDFPLYVMHYRGTYLFDSFVEEGIEWAPYQKLYKAVNPDACTSFAAPTPDGDVVFGRNLDWNHRSSLLLFTDPPGGYASVSLVDLYYLGLEGLQEIPWSQRFVLLAAPYATIDGMNECGVAIAQNAVPERNTPRDPNRPTLLNSQIMRLVLDYAKDVEEALTLIQQYNVEFVGPRGHFHLADASGASAIVEYVDGGIAIVRDDGPWQISTNFLLSEEIKPECWRYRIACQTLKAAQGSMSQEQAMDLLKAVKQNHTVWSVVYGLSTGQIRLAMGQDYENVHAFRLGMQAGP
ncbi:MAG: linear amide C-N hydrolase [Phycisphaerales bacterium]|nr:MAG: linear amide C-N hydrolase [Phycisphaerales bacterium]